MFHSDFRGAVYGEEAPTVAAAKQAAQDWLRWWANVKDENLRELWRGIEKELRGALAMLSQIDDAASQFLDVNELGLAMEELEAAGASQGKIDCRFWEALSRAASLMGRPEDHARYITLAAK
jgi:hypothetical protein